MSKAFLAELPTEDALRSAIARVRSAGFQGALDAFTPYAIDDIDDELGLKRPFVTAKLVPVFTVAAFAGYYVQRWCNAINYPIDVGGRPDNAGPSFAIITFVTGILVSFVAGFGIFLLQSGMPRLHQPIFQVEGFARASLDRFWLAADATHPTYDRARLEDALREVGTGRFDVVEQEGIL